jgi:predicted nucleotidyltransferase
LSDLAYAIEVARGAAEPLGQAYALVGGFAVSVRTEPRFTRDIDLVVAVADDARAEEFVARILADGHELVANLEHEEAQRLATSRIRLREGQMLDLLFASSGIEPEIADAADPLEVLPGVTVPVARVGHLLALKLLARDDDTRPQDASDIRRLIAVATADELALARSSVRLIGQRGFARGRDLEAALDEALDRAG